MSQWKQHKTSLEEYQARQLDRWINKVSPRNYPPTFEELRDMLKGLRWNFFNNNQTVSIGRFKFRGGIGIHLGRATAAVASHARFLALKPVPPPGVVQQIDAAKAGGLAMLIVGIYGNIRILTPTNVHKSGIALTALRGSEMWNELIIPDSGI